MSKTKIKSIFFSLMLISLVSCAAPNKKSSESEYGPQPHDQPVAQDQGAETDETKVAEKKESYGPQMVEKRAIVLVLGPGYERAFAHVGVLRAIKDEKIPVARIYGIETGALIGAIFSASATANEFDWNIQKIKSDIFLPSTLDISRLITGENNGSKVNDYLELKFKNTQFSELQTPLTVIVEESQNNEPMYIQDGFVKSAVRAALSEEGVISPTQWNGYTVRALGSRFSEVVEYAKEKNEGPVVVVDMTSGTQKPSVEGLETKYWEHIYKPVDSWGADLVLRPEISLTQYFNSKDRSSIIYAGKRAFLKNKNQIEKLYKNEDHATE